MALAYSYRRVSSGGQAQGEKSGLQRQEQALKDWMRRHPDFRLAEELLDPGVSAYTGRNRTQGALGRFLAAARSGSIPKGCVLVVEDHRRFSRQEPLDALESLIRDVWGQGLGFAVCSYQAGSPLFRETTGAQDLAMLSFLFAQAHAESDEKSKWSRGGWRKIYEAQDRGERPRHRNPYWIDRDESLPESPFRLNGHAKSIEAMFKMCLAGMGQTQIADELNAEGFAAPPASKDGRWNRGQVSQRLRDPAVTGLLQRRNSHDIPGYYPSVVDRETFTRAQRAKATRDRKRSTTKARKVHFLFSGLVRCAGCGSLLTYRAAGRYARPGHPGYVTCSDSAGAVAKQGATRCREQLGAWRKTPTINLPLDEAEAMLMATLSLADWQNLFPIQTGPEVEDLSRQIRTANDQLQELSGRIQRGENRLAEELTKEQPNEIQVAVLTDAISQAREQVPELEREISELNYRLSELRPQDPVLKAQDTVEIVSQFLQHGLQEIPKRMQFNSWLQQLGISWVMSGDAIVLHYNRLGPNGFPKDSWGTAGGELHALRAMGCERGFAFLFAGKNWFNQLMTGQGGVIKEPGKFPRPVFPPEVAAGLQEIARFRSSELGLNPDREIQMINDLT